MEKVITVNLGGNAYQFDESAYELLRNYLARADTQLSGNPDKAEIVRDLEQSIAEKSRRFIGPAKTVVSAPEVEQILREIGPVDGDTQAHAAAGTQASAPRDERGAASATPKRLYQIREGAIVSGICNGIGAYLSIDPTIVRVAFVVAGLVEMIATDDPPWMTVLAYVVLVFVVPYAKTPEQLAAAQGTSDAIPYRVQDFVERVKRKVGLKSA